MIYVIYKDDGAQGCCDQSMSTTAPRHELLIFDSETDFINWRNTLDVIISLQFSDKPPKTRLNPRIEAVFSDEDYTGYAPAKHLT